MVAIDRRARNGGYVVAVLILAVLGFFAQRIEDLVEKTKDLETRIEQLEGRLK